MKLLAASQNLQRDSNILIDAECTGFLKGLVSDWWPTLSPGTGVISLAVCTHSCTHLTIPRMLLSCGTAMSVIFIPIQPVAHSTDVQDMIQACKTVKRMEPTEFLHSTGVRVCTVSPPDLQSHSFLMNCARVLMDRIWLESWRKLPGERSGLKTAHKMLLYVCWRIDGSEPSFLLFFFFFFFSH